MKFTIDMPDVSVCSVLSCAYNVGASCRAKAITVGDGLHPGCDTFTESRRHAHGDTPVAGVGACKVAVCRYNRDLECAAYSIRVDTEEGTNAPYCATFELD